MPAYYNEIDPYAVQWLRNLIAAGHIAPGEVDERSVLDVCPDDLAGFTQCHFFAGIGAWSHALRLAGWPDDRPVWTGSCPCQPFSVAGVGHGLDDERHLWPFWQCLIAQCRPPVVFGEQVGAAIRHGWLDLVQTDLEGLGYAVGAAVLPAAGVGAPHIRERLWFVADSDCERRAGEHPLLRGDKGGRVKGGTPEAPRRGAAGGLDDDDDDARLERQRRGPQTEGGRHGAFRPTAAAGESGRVGDALSHGCAADAVGRTARTGETGGGVQQHKGSGAYGCSARADDGYWRDADWLLCRDGKWRPVEPGTFPLANGIAARVGRLRAYGNAIVPQVAAAFVMAYLGCRP